MLFPTWSTFPVSRVDVDGGTTLVVDGLRTRLGLSAATSIARAVNACEVWHERHACCSSVTWGGGYLTAGQVTSVAAKGSRGLGGARGFDREKDDFYPTPDALLDPLIERWRIHLTGGVWEPACGDGAICKALARHGLASVGTDLVDRGHGESRRDFLMELTPPAIEGVETDAIVTNPPFRLWREFAAHALGLDVGFVALLGRLQLLEGKRVSALFEETNLTAVMVSAGRVNMLPVVDGVRAEDKGHNGMIAWAWFVWVRHRAVHDRPRIEWFTPERPR